VSQVAYIYALGDPRDGSIFYVGQSTRPTQRFNSHRYEGRQQAKWLPPTEDDNPLYVRIAHIVQHGLDPVFAVLDVVPLSDCLYREQCAIRDFLAAGHKLLNRKIELPIPTDLPWEEALLVCGAAQRTLLSMRGAL
jgi:hypothetical protein